MSILWLLLLVIGVFVFVGFVFLLCVAVVAFMIKEQREIYGSKDPPSVPGIRGQKHEQREKHHGGEIG